MRRLLIIIAITLFATGCGTPREMPKTPPAPDFPPPIYTDNFPSPEDLMGKSLSELRTLRPLIQRVYHPSSEIYEYYEVLTNHPYFSSIRYFINYNDSKIYKIVYAQNADVHNEPAYRLALLDQLIKILGSPLVSKDGGIYIFNTSKYVYKLQNQELTCISTDITDSTN